MALAPLVTHYVARWVARPHNAELYRSEAKRLAPFLISLCVRKSRRFVILCERDRPYCCRRVAFFHTRLPPAALRRFMPRALPNAYPEDRTGFEVERDVEKDGKRLRKDEDRMRKG